MGTLLVLQGSVTYPVRYRYDAPPRTVHRLPPPRDLKELVQFLHDELGLEAASLQHLVAEVDRWGSGTIPFTLPVECEALFLPFDPR